MATQVRPTDAAIGQRVETLDTPALLVDLDIMERNIAAIAGSCARGGVSWRPHSKGLKTTAVARRCLAAGAIGMTCAKVGDAEWLADDGIDHLVIANEIIGDQKLDRLARLAARADVISAVDSRAGLEMAAAAARRNGVELGLVIEVDIGIGRCGARPGEETLALAKAISETPGVRFEGILAWEGHVLTIDDPAAKEAAVREAVGSLTATADLIRANGIPVRIVSASGTGTFYITPLLKGVTEIQAGGGIFGDRTYQRWGAPVEISLMILATVISRPSPTRIVIDAGRKAMSPDAALPPWPRDVPNVTGLRWSAEHCSLDLGAPSETPRVGDKLVMLAGYGDWTVILHDQIYAHRNGVVEEVWPVAPRSATR